MTQIGPGVTGIELVKVSEIWLIGMQHDMIDFSACQVLLVPPLLHVEFYPPSSYMKLYNLVLSSRAFLVDRI